MEAPLNHWKFYLGFPMDPCLDHCCSLFTLIMSLRSSSPMKSTSLRWWHCPLPSQLLSGGLHLPLERYQLLCGWTSLAYLHLNAAKCKGMVTVISRKKQPLVSPTPIQICGTDLRRANSFKYLGVWITKDLAWSRHVNAIARWVVFYSWNLMTFSWLCHPSIGK